MIFLHTLPAGNLVPKKNFCKESSVHHLLGLTSDICSMYGIFTIDVPINSTK